ncbi:hemin-degrading factor [Oceanobacter mangrovi]|uniref:hemin-degrading factor n=1 Tax=Oceanobacter mangrovi TaxID=2862510 RepID=UPI001C8E15BF|nr:ChuX/HutX family heme-like substrate-binding protein [Oceanobacter mangrovi]
MNPSINLSELPLAQAWLKLVDEQPKLRIRDAANLLGVSEAELLASQISAGDDQQQQVTLLQGPFGPLMKQLEAVGEVMVLTRNDAMVHEKTGQFKDLTLHGPVEHQMGLALGTIDLRLFLNHFVFGFEVINNTPAAPRRSLQFFDASGTAVHKVYARDNTDMQQWQQLVEQFRAGDQLTSLVTTSSAEESLLTSPAGLDSAALLQDWQNLKDVHHFQAMLKKHQLARVPAYQVIGEEYAVPLATSAFEQALESARESGQPIMVFVGNRGCIQIHTGPLHNLKRLGPWFNILDGDFNLHASTDQIASLWLVRKPTSDGIISSLEAYDSHGQQLALLFGQRQNGEAERQQWRTLLQKLASRYRLDSTEEQSA